MKIDDYVDTDSGELFVSDGMDIIDYYKDLKGMWVDHEELRSYHFPIHMITDNIIEIRGEYHITIEEFRKFRYCCSMINHGNDTSYCGINFIGKRSVNLLITDMSNIMVELKKEDYHVCLDTTHVDGDLYAMNYDLEIVKKIDLVMCGIDTLNKFYGVVNYPLYLPTMIG